MSAVRILIADNSDFALAGLKAVLAESPDIEVVGEARKGREVFKLCGQLSPDLVVLDLRMESDHDGFEAMEKLASHRPDTRILVLSNSREVADIRRALRLGAKGYVGKDSASNQELLLAVRLIAEGKSYYESFVTEALAQSSGPEEDLPDRLMRTLLLMAQGLPTSEIAKRLGVSQPSARAYIHEVVQSLGARNRTEAVLIAQKRGLVPSP